MPGGSAGSPDVCVTRSRSVTSRPSKRGIVTPAGRCCCTVSSSDSSLRSTISDSSTPVNAFEIEPISKRIARRGRQRARGRGAAVGALLGEPAVRLADDAHGDQAHAAAVAVDARGDDAVDLGVRRSVRRRREQDQREERRDPHGQKNAWMPVCARPRISAWMSCVPS